MRDSQAMDAERAMQPAFSKAAPLLILIPPLVILLFAWFLELTPDRELLGRRVAEIRLEPVRLDAPAVSPLRLAGAWRLTSDDPRLGGISALVAEPSQLVALSDSGVLVRFPRPDRKTARAVIEEIADGPGRAGFKVNRDTEAMAADPFGRGWWIAFEVHHQLWLYGPGLERALARINFGRERWHHNSGIEALAASSGELLAIREGAEAVFEIRGRQAMRVPIRGRLGLVSDAANLPDGRLLLLERRPTLRGFANALVWLEREEGVYRTGRRVPLPLGRLDNAEALAIEPLAGGALRLWLMTDDNYQPPFRTLLVAFEIPAALAAERH